MVNPVLKRALETWGEQAQMLMVVEEMSELMKEILKNINRKKNNIDEIIEETADVEIMLEQLKENYQIVEKVEAYKKDKIKIIEQRLDNWDKK
jgi:NTP pyrophosphatase (non-canonical NTP hydrolase)